MGVRETFIHKRIHAHTQAHTWMLVVAAVAQELFRTFLVSDRMQVQIETAGIACEGNLTDQQPSFML